MNDYTIYYDKLYFFFLNFKRIRQVIKYKFLFNQYFSAEK